jgi:phage terminase large subunit
MPLKPTLAERAIARARFLRDPILFQQHQLCRTLWAKQKEILRAVETCPLVAVKGCHASGKTFAAAGLPLWWLVRYNTGKVFTTAPTLRQVKTVWKDIAVARLSGPVRQLLPEPTSTGLDLSPSRYAFGASSSAGINIQGLHGSNVLIIADEAPGIESDIWDAIEGIRAGGNVHVLELGNPVIPSGHFYDSFTRNRSIYRCISISAFDTPNLQHPDGRPVTEDELLAMSPEELAYRPFPSLITREWVRERLKVWGPKHPKYIARVRGEFPSDDPASVFPLSWIERARRDPSEAELKRAPERVIQVGIDVAGAGADETVMTARVDGIVLKQWFWPDPDPRGAVVRELSQIRAGHLGYRLGLVVVDIVGIGYNFGHHLVDQGFPCYGFNAGGRAIDATQFVNQKAEAHWTFRTYLQENLVSRLADEETGAQLSTIRYRENSRGLTEIESKEARNQRGIPGSPDRAESLIMAFMRVVQQQTTVTFAAPYQISPI